ncbi:MAG: ATP--guanido phosphotransferase, partial [Fibrobacter sp.]|nr:ATP--guanido phosphotransferase [Fibrobacter sp.]
AIDNLSTVVRQIIATEEEERKQLIAQPEIQDKIWRSLGILRTARMLSGDETFELASNLRLGVACGVYKGEKIDPGAPSKLIALSGSATLTVKSGKKLSAAERDALRAETVRNIMGDH